MDNIMIKLCIFDFDGTLVDSITDVGLCFNTVLEKNNFPTLPLEEYKTVVGGNLEVVVSKILGPLHNSKENIEKIMEDYEKYYINTDKVNTKPYYGVFEMLVTLQNKNILLAINSNKKTKLLLDLVNKYFSNINFIDITGFSSVELSKPNPFNVLNTIEKANVNKNEVLYIGDTRTDILTAKNAGIDCVLVNWGQGKENDFNDENVSKVISKPSDLYELLGD